MLFVFMIALMEMFDFYVFFWSSNLSVAEVLKVKRVPLLITYTVTSFVVFILPVGKSQINIVLIVFKISFTFVQWIWCFVQAIKSSLKFYKTDHLENNNLSGDCKHKGIQNVYFYTNIFWTDFTE